MSTDTMPESLPKRLLKVWFAVGLGMLASFFAAWELAALIGSAFLFEIFSDLFWLCPAVGLASTAVLIYRAIKGKPSARAV